MTNTERELLRLRTDLIEMINLVKSQFEKSKIAFLNFDEDIADEIIHTEKRVNAMEISNDRDCETILGLISPVATDLRFVLSCLKINSDLERIGDYSEGIAKYVSSLETPFSAEILEAVKLEKMFDRAISMLDLILKAFENSDTKVARKVFKKDIKLNKIKRNATVIIDEFVQKKPELFKSSLLLFSTIQKIERTGDHLKNIAEEIIFYLEALVLKHEGKM